MIVDKKTLNKWRKLKQKGDISRMAELANIANKNMSEAFNSGNMTEEVYTVIATFYNDREQRVKELA